MSTTLGPRRLQRAAHLAACALIVTLGLATQSCSRGPRALNVVLISMDTTRRDHCSVYGYKHDTTPTLKRLAAGGVRFDEAYSPTPLTGPTHATVFTSRSPLRHRVVKNGLSLSEDFTTLAEVLRNRGYQTAGIVSAFVLDQKFGYAQGFDHYDDKFANEEATLILNRWEGHPVMGGFDRRADGTTRRAIEWLQEKRDGSRPFLLFVHYFDAHDPYLPPPAIAARFAPKSRRPRPLDVLVAHYDGEIAFADGEIGKLLDALTALGLDEETLVVVMGDHGEGLMDHGHLLHEAQLYEEQVQVPLILRWTGRIAPGRVVEAPVELEDLTPTIMGLAGVDAPDAGLRGRDLSAALLDGDGGRGAGGGRGSGAGEDGVGGLDESRPVFFYRRPYDPMMIGALEVRGEKYGVLADGWKYIEGPDEGTRELFNLEQDPEERRNLVDAEAARSSELADRVQAWVRVERQLGAAAPISEEDRARLRSLGYVN